MLKPTLLWAWMVHAIIKLQGEEGRVVSVSAKRPLWKRIRSPTSLQTQRLHKSFSGQRGGLKLEERRGLRGRGAFLHVPVSADVRARRGEIILEACVLFQSASIWGMQAGPSWHARITEKDAVNGASFLTRDKEEEVSTAGTKTKIPRMNGNAAAACAGNNSHSRISEWGKTNQVTLFEAWLACKVRCTSQRHSGCMPDRWTNFHADRVWMRSGGEWHLCPRVSLCSRSIVVVRRLMCCMLQSGIVSKRQKSQCQCT